jgi:hypothetical protein
MRTGAVIVAGAMVGQAVARRVAQHEDCSGERSRWLTVTVNAVPSTGSTTRSPLDAAYRPSPSAADTGRQHMTEPASKITSPIP